LAAYSGNYEFYHRQRQLLREQQRKAYEQQQEFLEKEQRWIDRFRYKNTKASQVQSRIKRLEKLERVEAPPPERSAAKFDFGDVARSGQWVVDATALSMGYGALDLYRSFSVQVTRGERVGIIGPNGSGKTTLLRHLAGRLSNEPNAKGVVTLGHKVIIGLYEQEHETLRRSMNLSNDVLTEIRNLRPDLTPERVRSFMGRFLFTGDDIFKSLATLSGGELSRVAIAKLILAGANLLLLDEPTNHLDIASREVIEEALMDFGGTILVVSHDRQLIDRLAVRLIVMENGEATVHWGNYSHYRWKRNGGGEPPSEASATAPSEASLRSEVLKIRADKPRRGKSGSRTVENEGRKKRRLIEELEHRIESVEQMVEDLEAQFCRLNPADHERIRTLKEEYDGLRADLRTLYEEWERLVSEQADRP
jgi:ATP-binding cassette subfamily F protein 3